METLVVVDQHKNQDYCRMSKQQGHAQFGSSPSTGFREINCRTFRSPSCFVQTSLKSHSSPSINSNEKTTPKTKTNPIPINGRKETTFIEDVRGGSFLLSELWAGPTYSNSPPPTSLPIPKFSMRPKRTVSLDLPSSSLEIEMRPIAKSAPSSPTREHLNFTKDFIGNPDSATKTLYRILNLDINDE